MAFQVDEKLPGTYFPDVINFHIILVKAHLDTLDTPLVFSPLLLICDIILILYKHHQ